MINTVELGRKMMAYAKNISDDSEFNRWCRLAPKLIGMGTATHPKNLKELSEDDQALVTRAFNLLVHAGELTVKN